MINHNEAAGKLLLTSTIKNNKFTKDVNITHIKREQISLNYNLKCLTRAQALTHCVSLKKNGASEIAGASVKTQKYLCAYTRLTACTGF